MTSGSTPLLTSCAPLCAGGASLQSGQAEVMLHRRVLHDDWRGVGEPLNETACGCRACHCDGLIVRGTHLLTLEVPPVPALPTPSPDLIIVPAPNHPSSSPRALGVAPVTCLAARCTVLGNRLHIVGPE